MISSNTVGQYMGTMSVQCMGCGAWHNCVPYPCPQWQCGCGRQITVAAPPTAHYYPPMPTYMQPTILDDAALQKISDQLDYRVAQNVIPKVEYMFDARPMRLHPDDMAHIIKSIVDRITNATLVQAGFLHEALGQPCPDRGSTCGSTGADSGSKEGQ